MIDVQIIVFLVLMTTINCFDSPIDNKTIKDESEEESHKKLLLKDFIELAQNYGYQTEKHTVTTDDGYIFQIFRIPKSILFPKANEKPVVLIEHGLAASSDIWGFFNRSLAYVLADAGYDVWLGNCRGNTYGRLHQELSPNNPVFWNFTWHEIGKIDYSSTIDYILNTTNKFNLTFIGYSMGGTALMVLLSERPEYNEKINVVVNLAPCVLWKKQHAMRSTFFNIVYRLKDALDPYGMAELLSQGTLSIRLINNICRDNFLDFCVSSFKFLSGHNREEYNKDELLFLINYFPAGSSTKCLWHFCQLVHSGKFRKYNYGVKNFLYYGQMEPPAYNLSNVAANMVIIYGKNDPFSSREDIDELSSRLSANVIIEAVKDLKFSHFDFIIAKDVKKIVYNRIVKIISKYQN